MDWLQFLPSFFGVLAAFGLNRYWSWIEDGRSRKKLYRDIKRELEQCSVILQGIERYLVKESDYDIYLQKGNLLPMDIWKSGVSSGSLRLIPYDHKTKFAEIYFRIESHNNDAEKVREVGTLGATLEKPKTTETRQFTNLEKLQNELHRNLRDSDSALHTDINNLLKQIYGDSAKD